jgi:hypothetical protein
MTACAIGLIGGASGVGLGGSVQPGGRLGAALLSGYNQDAQGTCKYQSRHGMFSKHFLPLETKQSN